MNSQQLDQFMIETLGMESWLWTRIQPFRDERNAMDIAFQLYDSHWFISLKITQVLNKIDATKIINTVLETGIKSGSANMAVDAAKHLGRKLTESECDELISQMIYWGINPRDEFMEENARAMTANEKNALVSRCLEIGKVQIAASVAEQIGKTISPEELWNSVWISVDFGDLCSIMDTVDHFPECDQPSVLALIIAKFKRGVSLNNEFIKLLDKKDDRSERSVWVSRRLNYGGSAATSRTAITAVFRACEMIINKDFDNKNIHGLLDYFVEKGDLTSSLLISEMLSHKLADNQGW